jgi:phosphoribosyl-AMP cyclohydrolase
MRNVHRFVVGKPEGKNPLGRNTDMWIMLVWSLTGQAVHRNAALAKGIYVHRPSWEIWAGGAVSGSRVEHGIFNCSARWYIQ